MLPERLPRIGAVLLACTALLAAPCALDAQKTVEPGAQVRIMAPSAADTLITGTVVEIDSASLVLAPRASAGARTVDLGDIERLEAWGPGAPRTLWGALAGTVAGAVAGYTVCHVASGSPHANCPTTAASYIGGTLGLIMGAVIGSGLRGRDGWHPAVAPRW